MLSSNLINSAAKAPDRDLRTLVYDYVMPEASIEAFNFYSAFVQRTKGPVLEPMCATGRFLLSFMEQGFNFVGTDISKSMLDICRKKSEQCGLNPVLHECSIVELNLGRTYELIIIPLSSISLITDLNELHSALHAVYNHLAPGGTFLVEVDDIAGKINAFDTWSQWFKLDESEIVTINGTDGLFNEKIQSNESLIRYELIKDGKVVQTEFQEYAVRLYDVNDFAEILTACGFVDLSAFGQYSVENYQGGDDSFVVECKKPYFETDEIIDISTIPNIIHPK